VAGHKSSRDLPWARSLMAPLQPQATFSDFREDYTMAIGWARKTAGEYGGDAATLFVSGNSAGAHRDGCSDGTCAVVDHP
jgi:hypothetical protein